MASFHFCQWVASNFTVSFCITTFSCSTCFFIIEISCSRGFDNKWLCSWIDFELFEALIARVQGIPFPQTSFKLQNHQTDALSKCMKPWINCFKTFNVTRPVHRPYSSVFVTEFNPEYGNAELLIWLQKNSHLLNTETLMLTEIIVYSNFLR